MTSRPAWLKRIPSWAPIALVVALLARSIVHAVYAKVGHAAPTLDDAYIHFQYARAIAEGHPLRFQAGEPLSTGSTSLLWPLLLAPFYAIGFKDVAIVWPAWVMSFLALGALAHEAYELTRGLAGRYAAIGAAAMVLSFGGFAWCAASGMEVVPFAWLIARGARRASEWSEEPEGRTPKLFGEIVLLAWAAPLMRPEGAVTSVLIAATLALFPRKSSWKDRARGGVALVAVVGMPLLFRALTGHAQASTTEVKLLVGNPYFDLGHVVAENVRTLLGTLLNGEVWSAEFLPRGGASFALAGLGAIAASGLQTKRRWRALCVLAIALTMFVPCTYVTFLWNRLRYLWPFATGWLIGLACLARHLGDLAARLKPRWAMLTPVLCGSVAGMFAVRLDGVIDDVAGSASGIDRQQATLGRWARENLPGDARIGLNDTGAIAYFSNRHTFDVVGLTTPSEGRYWVAGAGSRLEHYERLHRAEPSRLPTHFIVYPEWMVCDPVLGHSLFEVTVTDASILGGQTMRVYEAEYRTLGSGELPWSSPGPFVDTIDVADLDSETEHAYELLGARDGEQVASEGHAPDGRTVVDGGRTNRTRERFAASLTPGVAATGLARLESPSGATLTVLADGVEIAKLDVRAEGWVESDFAIPPGAAKARTTIELRAESGTFTAYHYWFRPVK